MKQRFTKLLAAFALLVFMMPSMAGWGQTRTDELAYAITFKDNGTSNDGTQAQTTIQNVIASGSDYLSSITCTNVYNASSGNGIKLGSGSNKGSILLNFNGTGAITATVVKANIKMYDSGKTVKVYVNNSEEGISLSPTTDFVQYEITINANITSIKFEATNASKNRFYIKDLEVYESASAPSTISTTVTIDDTDLTNTDVYSGTSAGFLTATVTPEGGSPLQNPAITWTSSNTGVATINANGAVTLVAAGTTTIRATYAGNATYSSSFDEYELTVTNSVCAILPFEWEGGVLSVLSDEDGVSYSLNDQGSYAESHGLYRIKFTKTGDYIQVKTDSRPGIVTIGVKMIGGATTSYITVQGSTNGETFDEGEQLTISGSQNDILTLTSTRTFDSDVRYVRLLFTKGANVGVGPITIAKHSTTPIIAASNVEIAHNATGGSIAYTINNEPAPAGTLTAAIVQGGAIENLVIGTISNGAVAFTCGENSDYSARTSTVTLTYTYNTNETVTKNVTITQFAAPQQFTLTIADPDHVSLTAVYDGDEILVNDDVAQILVGTEISVSVLVDEGYVLQSFIVVGEGGQNVTYNEAGGFYNFNMPSFNVIVNATVVDPSTATTYTLATSIESGKQYIIVGKADSKYYAMGEDRGNNRNAYQITSDGTAASAIVTSGNAVHEFTISSLGEGFYSICDAIAPGYLYAAHSNNNYLKTEETLDENHNGDWKITFNSETGVASVVASQSSNRNVMQFNNGSTIFSCYSSASQHPVYLYKKDEVHTYTKHIDGYSEDGGWNLIASPVNVNINPVNAGMITDSYVSTNVTPENGTYDLYCFNQSADLEWENYRVHSFALESGKGYLYASKNGVTIQFTGTPYNSNGEISLVYIAGKDFAGWNLIGNPFTTASTIDLPYYKMNDGRTALTSKIEGGTIAAMEGVFVYAYDETTQQPISSVTFTASRSRGNSNASVNIDVMHNGANIDNAIVRFDEGRQLPKYQLFKNSTKLYIPKNGKDYAIVNSEAQGEMPVSFKAEENGTYSLNIDTENVEMNYLHLIDNMTGMDVDLLQTPSYTFDATTNDYTSRFRLVFSANNVDGPSTGSETFAFYSNGEWVVGNEGEATLQVIDVNGRIVSNETINGSVATSINATPGVYMLRLVNGNEVKTQKIVVR